MTEAPIDPDAVRVDAPSEARLPSRHRPVEPGLLAAGVYSSRPLAPLRDAVTAALESPSGEEVRRGPDLGPLWRRPVLRGRLVQAFGDHARRCGAGRIAASDPGALPLASAVAERLAVPLDSHGRDGEEREPAGRARYLLARVLHEGHEGRRYSGDVQRPERTVGAGVLFRIRSSGGEYSNDDKVMSIIDL